MNGATGAVPVLTSVFLPFGARRVSCTRSRTTADHLQLHLFLLAPETHKGSATIPDGSLRGPHLTRRCSRQSDLSRSVRGTARAISARG